MTNLSPDSVPAGFTRHFRQSPATDPWEPLWSRQEETCFRLGLVVATPHCNSRGQLHGGIISALADNCMGLACALALGGKVPIVTVNLSVDYLGVAALGAWLEIIGTAVKTGRTLCFGAADILANGKPVARATAVFSVVQNERPAQALL